LNHGDASASSNSECAGHPGDPFVFVETLTVVLGYSIYPWQYMIIIYYYKAIQPKYSYIVLQIVLHPIQCPQNDCKIDEYIQEINA
jgi:hypothetical protein